MTFLQEIQFQILDLFQTIKKNKTINDLDFHYKKNLKIKWIKQVKIVAYHSQLFVSKRKRVYGKLERKEKDEQVRHT